MQGPEQAGAQRNLPEWLVYPDAEWETAGPAEAGLDAEAFSAWVRDKP